VTTLRHVFISRCPSARAASDPPLSLRTFRRNRIPLIRGWSADRRGPPSRPCASVPES
jgi:hypothetical protein